MILLRTSATKVLNHATDVAAVVYAQHDTGLQVILIWITLKEQLGLEPTPDPLVIIYTLADKKVANGGRNNF